MITPLPAEDRFEEQRVNFIGRVQEQRQFQVALQGLLAHQQGWLFDQLGSDFDPAQAPSDDSYARIFLLHGIGGIGKSWLARRCLALAEAVEAQPSILTLYDDVSLGPPLLEPAHLLDRLAKGLLQAGYETEVAPYYQAQSDLPGRTEMLFRPPPAAQAAQLVAGLQRIARQRPLIIALDNLEIAVSLEPFLRDDLVLPTNRAPIIWLLSGRYNLADERIVEIAGEKRDYKGYRDLLGDNPPIVWDMSIFGDADLREYLQAEASRRHVSLQVDDDLIDAVKSTSSGVPLVVEMVADALFALDRADFWRDFVLDDQTLLPAGRLEQITTRFLRYCLTREDDLERVQGLALLRKGAAEPGLQAVWALLPGQAVRDTLHELRVRYAFVLATGLHDAVYDFVRRQLRTLEPYQAVRDRLSRRAVAYYQVEWARLEEAFNQLTSPDPIQRIRDPHWQEATRDLLNALLWADPDEAMRFLLPRFVEGLGFDRPLAEGLLLQAEEFLTDSTAPVSRAYVTLLPRLQLGLKVGSWSFELDAHRESLNSNSQLQLRTLLDTLLQTPGLEPLHLSILHLWWGDWLVREKRPAEALTAYLAAEEHGPATATRLGRQLGKAFYELSSLFLWPEGAGEPVPSEPGRQAAQHAVVLDAGNSRAWFNLGVALKLLGRHTEAVSAYQRAIALEAQSTYYNDLGEIYLALSDYVEASAAYRQAIELDPTYAWPYHNLGFIHERQGKYELALSQYRQALERHHRDPDKAVSWSHLGNVHVALNNLEEAIAAYRQASVLDATSARPWQGLGDVYGTLQRHEEAIQAYQQALTLEPANGWSYDKLGVIYEQRGAYQPALALYHQALERHTGDSARAVSWHHLGHVYHTLSRTDEALEAYQRATELDPSQALTWSNLGDIYLARHRHEEAGQAYQQAIKLKPDLAWPYHNLGLIYEKRNEYEPALTAYRQAIEHHEHDLDRAAAWYHLGHIYQALGRQPEAIAAYQQASQLDPTNPWPAQCLGQIYEERGDWRSHTLAAAYYRQAIARHKQDLDRAAALHRLGDIYMALDRYKQAGDAYRQVTELMPTNAAAWQSLGDIYRLYPEPVAGQLDRTEAAGQAYLRAIELNPQDAWPYHKLGLIYEQRGQSDPAAYEVAIARYQQAIERHAQDQDRAVAWHHLGNIYTTLDHPEAALEAYRQASQLDPDNALIWNSLGNIYLRLEPGERRSPDRPTEAIQAYQRAIELDPAYAWPYHNLGLIYKNQGETDPAAYELAITSYQQAIERHQEAQDQAISWHNLGQVYHRLDRLEEASQAYHQAITLDPMYTWPYYHLGLIHESRSDYGPALAFFRQTLECHPNQEQQALAWQHLGNVHQALGQLETALAAYRRASELNSTYALSWSGLGDVYTALDRYQEAITAYQRATELEPAATLLWYSLGNVYSILGHYDEAGAAYWRASQLEPEAAWPYQKLGLIYEKQGEVDRAAYELAIDYYQQAIERHQRDSDRATAWYHLGNIYYALARYEEALTAYQQALELDPNYAFPWNSLGSVYSALNRQKEAIAAYRRASELDPAYAWPYHNLGLIFENQEEYELAQVFYQQAIKRHRQDTDKAISWHNLGHVYTTLGRYQQAIEAYRRALQLNPNYAPAWNGLGDLYSDLDQSTEAIRAYQQAIELAPTYAWPYNNLGLIYEKHGEYEKAMALYQQVIERHAADSAGSGRPDRDRAIASHSLGNVYSTLGRTGKAVEAYRQAIELDPTYIWPYHSLGAVCEGQGDYEQALKLYQQATDQYRDKVTPAG